MPVSSSSLLASTILRRRCLVSGSYRGWSTCLRRRERGGDLGDPYAALLLDVCRHALGDGRDRDAADRPAVGIEDRGTDAGCTAPHVVRVERPAPGHDVREL